MSSTALHPFARPIRQQRSRKQDVAVVTQQKDIVASLEPEVAVR